MSDRVLEFYFEFSSPYGYIASELIEDFAAKRGLTIAWKPFLIGAAFKQAGTRPLLDIPLKGPYAVHDLKRLARLHGLPAVIPEGFPIMPVAACRALIWCERHAPDRAVDLIHAIYRYGFADGKDFGKAPVVAEIAGGLGLHADAVLAGTQDPEIKAALREQVEAAIAKGVFGSPFFIFEGEPFWGVDHMDLLGRWIDDGGW